MSSSRYEGWLLAGRYRLVAGLGRGGTATVWHARDELLRREVAVKEVTVPDHLTRPEREVLLERTMREARLAARLTHPNIAAVYDVVRADDRLWIVMQLVRSRDLAEVIAEEGRLPAPAVARVGLEVLSALEAAHAAGVMHRDVKPANILLADDGRAILTDFGLATAVDEDVSLTTTGMVVGTPAYIAPERAGGVASSAESDLWSFGATLYAAVEGRSAFGRGTALATLAAVLTSDPDPFRHAGPMAPVIAGLLDKDPLRRTGAVRARRQLEEVAMLWERGADSTVAPLLTTPVATPAIDGGSTAPSGTGRRSVEHRPQAGTGRHLTGHHHHEDSGPRDGGHRLREDAGHHSTGRHLHGDAGLHGAPGLRGDPGLHGDAGLREGPGFHGDADLHAHAGRRAEGETGATSARLRSSGRRRLSAGVAALAVGVLAALAVAAEWRGGGPGTPELITPSGSVPVTAPQPTRTPETRRVLGEEHHTATPRRDGRTDATSVPAATESSGGGTSRTGAKEAGPNSNKDKTKNGNKGHKPPQRGNGRGNNGSH
ncbi:serine/threonine-protein kinase [Streptosporangium sp. NPDC048865]|uniref:serine/threonine-protein kinase n=1 Tax=Streptosporangium sp. NPDC048865 TaxID=3155766 RepID=UPI00343A59B8